MKNEIRRISENEEKNKQKQKTALSLSTPQASLDLLRTNFPALAKSTQRKSVSRIPGLGITPLNGVVPKAKSELDISLLHHHLGEGVQTIKAQLAVIALLDEKLSLLSGYPGLEVKQEDLPSRIILKLIDKLETVCGRNFEHLELFSKGKNGKLTLRYYNTYEFRHNFYNIPISYLDLLNKYPKIQAMMFSVHKKVSTHIDFDMLDNYPLQSAIESLEEQLEELKKNAPEEKEQIKRIEKDLDRYRMGGIAAKYIIAKDPFQTIEALTSAYQLHPRKNKFLNMLLAFVEKGLKVLSYKEDLHDYLTHQKFDNETNPNHPYDRWVWVYSQHGPVYRELNERYHYGSWKESPYLDLGKLQKIVKSEDFVFEQSDFPKVLEDFLDYACRMEDLVFIHFKKEIPFNDAIDDYNFN